MDTKADLEVCTTVRAALVRSGASEARADAWGRYAAARCRSAARAARHTGADFDMGHRAAYWLDVARAEIAAGLNPPVSGGAS